MTRGGRWQPGAVAVPAALVAAAVWYVGPSTADDTFIYMRYVDSLLHGAGVSFNPGVPSYGVTSAAWMWLMAAPAAVLGNTLAVWKAASWVWYAAVCVGVFAWAARRWRVDVAVALVLTALLVEPHVVRWSGTGMETSLAALVVVLMVLGWRDTLGGVPRPSAAAVLLGLAPLVRPELGLLALLLIVEWGRLALEGEQRRAWVAGAAGAAAVAALAACGMFMLTGFWLPQTAAAKALSSVQAAPLYALTQAGRVLASGAALFIPSAIGLWILEPSTRRLLRPAAVYLVIVWAYLARENHLVSTRYYVTLAFPLAVATAAAALDVLGARARPGVRRIVVAVSVAQIAASVAVLGYLSPGTRTNEGEDIRRFAERVREVTSPRDRVALSEVGAFGFYSGRLVIDTVGLTDPGTVTWMKTHGSLQREGRLDLPTLERFLIDRQATYYVDAFASASPLVGSRLAFVPVLEAPVQRNVESGWDRGLWRLYRIERH